MLLTQAARPQVIIIIVFVSLIALMPVSPSFTALPHWADPVSFSHELAAWQVAPGEEKSPAAPAGA